MANNMKVGVIGLVDAMVKGLTNSEYQDECIVCYDIKFKEICCKTCGEKICRECKDSIVEINEWWKCPKCRGEEYKILEEGDGNKKQKILEAFNSKTEWYRQYGVLWENTHSDSQIDIDTGSVPLTMRCCMSHKCRKIEKGKYGWKDNNDGVVRVNFVQLHCPKPMYKKNECNCCKGLLWCKECYTIRNDTLYKYAMGQELTNDEIERSYICDCYTETREAFKYWMSDRIDEIELPSKMMVSHTKTKEKIKEHLGMVMEVSKALNKGFIYGNIVDNISWGHHRLLSFAKNQLKQTRWRFGSWSVEEDDNDECCGSCGSVKDVWDMEDDLMSCGTCKKAMEEIELEAGGVWDDSMLDNWGGIHDTVPYYKRNS